MVSNHTPQKPAPDAYSVKAKAAITWVSVMDGVPAEVRLYDRLFADAHPDAGGKDFLQSLNPDSLKVVTATWSHHWPLRSRTRSFSLSGLGTLSRIAWIMSQRLNLCLIG